MTLPAGHRIGAYEIQGLLGAGGMGEVYRARDTKLDREVAIKILPDAFADDPERVGRFEREAKALASLNHPHIGAIYGLEEAAGITALVLELVDGPTLADRVAQGPIPIDEALPIARQIAEALQAAHEHAIIHRDLKPANIKLRPDGTVKVLDFGLAKMFESDAAESIDLTRSPTLSVAATHAGVILGTAAYMAPEQAKGRRVDKRIDVWAFGCVLYEMLAGRRAFDGEDVTDIIGAVVRLEPNWAALPPECPPALRTLLQRCLDKDPRKRIADISTALFVLDDTRMLSSASEGPARAGRHVRQHEWRRVALFSAASAVLVGVVVGSAVWVATRPAPPRVTRTTMTLPEDAALRIDGGDRDLVMTPDGTRLVYATGEGTTTQIFVRALDALAPAAIVAPIETKGSAGGVQGLFTSPDGEWVGYIVRNTVLHKVAITGGPAVTLLTLDGNSRGLTWAANDTIVFATANPKTGLQSVPSGGGASAVLTRPDADAGEADHLWPEALPNGRGVLFTITAVEGGLDATQVAVLDLNTGTHRTLLRGGSDARYTASGHLVYAAAGTLRSVAFDLDRLETRGTSVPVLPRVLMTTDGGADFSIAADGTLVYVDTPGINSGARITASGDGTVGYTDASGGNSRARRTIVWVDREGREHPIGVPPRAYVYARLSPDGTRVALDVRDGTNDIWVWDVARQTLTRLTRDAGFEMMPVWTPDGRRIAFSAERNSVVSLYWQAADGSTPAEQLFENADKQPLAANAFGAEGTTLLFSRGIPIESNLGLVSLTGDRKPEMLLRENVSELNGAISPDGRWLAYQSNESGRDEVYVRPFPAVTTGRWQVSTDGGTRPLWARNGRELFYYVLPGVLMSVPVGPSTTFSAGAPTVVLKGPYLTPLQGRQYDVSADGQRFLMIKDASQQGDAPPVLPQVIVVQNWLEELKRLVPTD